MSLAAIRARGYQPQAVIIPDESVIHTRDSGYLFKYPTYTYTPATGERNQIAEKRPELLVSGAGTAALSRTPSFGGGYQPDYARIGDTMSALRGESGSSSVADNRVINFNGSTDMETYRKFRSWDAREKALSAGRRRGPS